MSAANALLGNHSNECRIVVNMKRAKYNFTLDSKITIITGNSFTGKTNFCKAVRSQSSGGIGCNYNIHYIDNIYKLNSLGESDLAVIDLDFVIYEDNAELQRVIQKSKCLVLLITRQESLCSISYSVDSIKHIMPSNDMLTLTNSYPKE